MNDTVPASTRLEHTAQTTVAVPAAVYAVALASHPAEKPIVGVVSVAVGCMSVVFFWLAFKVDPDPELPFASAGILFLMQGALLGAAALFGFRALVRKPDRIEMTAATISLPGPLPTSTRTLLLADLTEANITTLNGHRSLVLATPTTTAMVQQRKLAAADWERLITQLKASTSVSTTDQQQTTRIS